MSGLECAMLMMIIINLIWLYHNLRNGKEE